MVADEAGKKTLLLVPVCVLSHVFERQGEDSKGSLGIMVNRNLLRQFDLPEDELQQELDAAFNQDRHDWLPPEEQEFEVNKIVTGRVLNVIGDEVWVDVGYKSEGVIPLRRVVRRGPGQGRAARSPATRSRCCSTPSRTRAGAIVLSYRKAKRQKEWEEVIAKHKEGDVVSGTVTRKIKGGLLVNIGVNVFLPASQVDIRRPPDIADYIGKTIECKILKIDEARRNIVVSRRKLIEDQREEMKKKLLAEIEPGQIRKGVVKNIAEFGAFVDLGGIDGLLHITDMSWGRVANPHEVVHIDQQLEVYIIAVDKEKEKIALGLKQKTPSPWAERRGQVPRRQPAHRRGRQRHELRRLRQAGAGHRGPGPHQRDELDQAHQPSQRAGRPSATRSRCRS